MSSTTRSSASVAAIRLLRGTSPWPCGETDLALWASDVAAGVLGQRDARFLDLMCTAPPAQLVGQRDGQDQACRPDGVPLAPEAAAGVDRLPPAVNARRSYPDHYRFTAHVHPADAAACGMRDDGMARLVSRTGSIVVPITVVDTLRQGVVSMPDGPS
jgi:hypothetical protein